MGLFDRLVSILHLKGKEELSLAEEASRKCLHNSFLRYRRKAERKSEGFHVKVSLSSHIFKAFGTDRRSIYYR